MGFSSKSLLVVLMGVLFLIACDEADNFNEGPFFSKRTEITSFEFRNLSELGNKEPAVVRGNIDKVNGIITATVPFGSDTTALTPTISTSAKSTIAPASGVTNSFTDTATYTVIAEDGTSQEWKIVVRRAPEGAVARLVLSEPIWNLSPSGTGVPSFIKDRGERGLAYGNGHLYMTNNKDKVLIIDPTDGSTLGTLSETGIDEGDPKISDVEVSDDSSILACNTVEWEGGDSKEFKIYRWENESSNPTLFLSYTNSAYRMGDTFSVIGNVSTNAVILTTFGRKFLGPVENARGTLLFRWNVINGAVDAQPTIIDVEVNDESKGFGSRPHAQMLSIDSNFYYVNGNEINFQKVSLTGEIESVIKNNNKQLYDGLNSYFEVFKLQGKTVIASIFPRSAIESRFFVIDATNGLENVVERNVVFSKNLMGTAAIRNDDGSGAIAINKIDDSKIEIYCLITNQALVKYELTTEL